MTIPTSILKGATSLNIILLDSLVTPPRKPMSAVWSMVQASPAAARVLLEHIESDQALIGNRLALSAAGILRSMLARQEARRLLDEIENTGDEK